MAVVLASVSGSARAASARCAEGPALTGITLSPGFCATVFADNLGHVRHLVVAPDGVVYANTWVGPLGVPPAGGFLVALRDTTGAGRADVIRRFGPDVEDGAAGGTGIALYKGGLYAEINDVIVRYALVPGKLLPSPVPQVIVSGLPLTGDHTMHAFAIGARGDLYVNVGTATNSCQLANHIRNSPGRQPCTELATRGGIWRYDATRTGQRFSPAARYATGLRNVDGLSFDGEGRLFATQHGRDSLAFAWPRLYTARDGATRPAEELVRLDQDADYGWPECYFDGARKKLVLAPEYGGDGGKKIGVCAEKRAPVAFFPAHWAPNDLLIYTGTAFPKPYQGGAFIAFHGSWNRAPEPQGGYNVVFQPLVNGRAAGGFVVFADGFAGGMKDPGEAAFRPSGLALGPDGALYIGDDVHGRIWRVTYQGGHAAAGLAPARAPAPVNGPSSARAALAALPAPPHATRAELAAGDRIFHGEAAGGTCSGCHGADAKGSTVGPDLASGHWLWGDGSPASIAATIATGVAHPKNFAVAMPPKGGAPLSPADVAAVASYVWAVGHAAAAAGR
jgi:glucose/arabinose dehydrogenase